MAATVTGAIAMVWVKLTGPNLLGAALSVAALVLLWRQAPITLEP